MMKCPYCGSPLDLDDNFCSHCGKLNEQVRQHVNDMNRYNTEFYETKEDVYETTSRYKTTSVRVVVIAVLVILCVTMSIVLGQSYGIIRDYRRSASERNFEEYSAVLDEYLINGEYQAFEAFVNYHAIDYFDSKYEVYEQVMPMVSQYCWIYTSMMDIATADNMERQLNEIQNMVVNFETFYRWRDNEFSYNASVNNEVCKNAVVDIEESLKALLITYCGLTEEEADAFDTYTSSQRGMLLEEGLLHD